MKHNRLAIVVPCYNEEDVFGACTKELTSVMGSLISKGKVAPDSFITYVDDGSRDRTWSLIAAASSEYETVRGIKLAGNVGHQKALLAGLSRSDADMIVTIDADLQDDTLAIEKMVDEYLDGADIVYGVRCDRSSDTFFKRKTAETFYNVMSKLGVQQVPNHADFRLMSQRAVQALLSYPEQNVYLRGLVPMIGFKSTAVEYARKEREAGESKYPLGKMLSLAINGITSFSVFPLRLISYTGFLVALISALCALFVLYQKFTGSTVVGWSSVMVSLYFICGIQMLSLGVIGEYIGKIYVESKSRPKFFIEEETVE